MALSIKSEEADQLARELSRMTGESMTEAVTNSLRERLERQRLSRPKRRSAKEKADEIRRLNAWLEETRKNYDFSRPVTKAEFDEACGENDILAAMGRK